MLQNVNKQASVELFGISTATANTTKCFVLLDLTPEREFAELQALHHPSESFYRGKPTNSSNNNLVSTTVILVKLSIKKFEAYVS